MKFNVQYSTPPDGDNKIAASDWQERIRVINATTNKEAIHKFNAKHQHLGAWLVLDCWKQ